MVPIIVEYSNTTDLNTFLKPYLKSHTLLHEIKNDDTAISISQIKELIRTTKLSSAKNEKLLYLIRDFDSASTPAQNALLKTLEELHDNQLIILTAQNANSLLPTIHSRSQLIKIGSNTSVTTPFSMSDLITDTDEIIAKDPQKYLTSILPSIAKINPQIAHAIINCLLDLKRNVNPKLAVDHFLFTISSLSTTMTPECPKKATPPKT